MIEFSAEAELEAGAGGEDAGAREEMTVTSATAECLHDHLSPLTVSLYTETI